VVVLICIIICCPTLFCAFASSHILLIVDVAIRMDVIQFLQLCLSDRCDLLFKPLQI